MTNPKPLTIAEIILLVAVVIGGGMWLTTRKNDHSQITPATVAQHIGPWPSRCIYDDNYYYDEYRVPLIERKYVLKYTPADEPTKQYSSPYVSDGKQVFWVGHDLNPECMPLEGADPIKVVALDGEWAKDDAHVYYHGRLVAGADAPTFQLVGRFAKDSSHLYNGQFGTAAESPVVISTRADIATFQSIDNLYYKDKYRVYLLDDFGFNELKNSDPTTFTILERCGSSEAYRRYYSKDKVHVWCHTTLMDADAVTFKYIGEYNVCEEDGPPCTAGIAVDKKCIYKSDKKVTRPDGTCYDPSTCSASNLESSCHL